VVCPPHCLIHMRFEDWPRLFGPRFVEFVERGAGGVDWRGAVAVRLFFVKAGAAPSPLRKSRGRAAYALQNPSGGSIQPAPTTLPTHSGGAGRALPRQRGGLGVALHRERGVLHEKRQSGGTPHGEVLKTRAVELKGVAGGEEHPPHAAAGGGRRADALDKVLDKCRRAVICLNLCQEAGWFRNGFYSTLPARWSTSRVLHSGGRAEI
jgi:hypothetical protein